MRGNVQFGIIGVMTMSAGDREKWRANYRATVELLARIRDRELYEMTDEQALRIIHSLNVAEPPWRERPDWSGLVEQQAIFHRRRKS
jgi:hypothetical protein